MHKMIWYIQAYNDKGTGNYKEAKRSGNIAIYLTLINIIYTLVVDILIIGLTLPLHCSEFLHINISMQLMLSIIQSIFFKQVVFRVIIFPADAKGVSFYTLRLYNSSCQHSIKQVAVLIITALDANLKEVHI